MEYGYKISVIVPVYNCEKFIENCFNSLKKQTIGIDNIHIIFVNDGSRDSSDEICKKIADENANVTYFSKENGGVSSARNAGLKLAKGKYIIFLDCDDTITDNSLLDIYNYFELHENEVDLVTYSINYINDFGEVSTHKRFNILTHTGIYDLRTDSNILQTTMNVCVKNLPNDEKIYFDESLSLGEDQWFIFLTLMPKKKLGFVKEAAYNYFRHSDSASSTFNNPYYCFNQFISFLNKLTTYKLEENGYIEPIAQALVVYNFGWRIASDMLVCHYDKELEAKQTEAVGSILKKVDNSIICNSIYVDDYHIEYLMRLKGEKYNVMINKNTYTVNDGKNLWFSQPLLVVFDNVKLVEDNKLYISGYTKNSVLTYKDIQLFYYDIDNNKHYLPLRETSYSYYKSKSLSNSFGGFEGYIDLNEKNIFFFRIQIANKIITPALFFSYKCAINREKNTAVCGEYIFNYDGESRCLFVDKAQKNILDLTAKQTDKKVLSYSKAAFVYRTLAKTLYNGKKIWLYCDREGIFDNGYYQFLHDFNKNDGIDRYYIYDGKIDKNQLFDFRQRAHLVKFKSLKHKLLFLNCSKILTSFNSISIISPFDSTPLRWYSDLTHYEVIYLQHGILHARLPLLYAKEKANADKIVISSEFERKNFTEIYHFSDNDLIMAGMPRFDNIDIKIKASNRILFSPSWRQNLIGEYINNKRALNVNAFTNSAFFQSIDIFLNSNELAQLLEKYDLQLDFKNHPIFKDYDFLFNSKCNRVHITQDTHDMQDYCAMITDYSSIVFDFVYVNRPILYFVPDIDQFRAGVTHSYNKLDLPLEEGFGEIAYNSYDLLENLKYLAEHNFEPKPIYAERMNNFFSARDKAHAERLYKALIK